MSLVADKTKKAILNPEVVKAGYTTTLNAWQGQKFDSSAAGSFQLETITVKQVEKLIKAGSKDFAKAEAKAVEKTADKKQHS